MLARAILDQRPIGYVLVRLCEAVGEAEIEFWFRVHLGSAQHDDVAEALGGAVQAGHGVGGGVDPDQVVSTELVHVESREESGEGLHAPDIHPDEAQLEVHLVADVLHRGQDQVLKAVFAVRAL